MSFWAQNAAWYGNIGFSEVLYMRDIRIPFLTLHYCWGERLSAAESWGLTGVFRVSSPTFCLDQVQWEQAAQSLARPAFSISKDGDATTPLGNLLQCLTMTSFSLYWARISCVATWMRCLPSLVKSRLDQSFTNPTEFIWTVLSSFTVNCSGDRTAGYRWPIMLYKPFPFGSDTY